MSLTGYNGLPDLLFLVGRLMGCDLCNLQELPLRTSLRSALAPKELFIM
jgi:hypothetical protein